MRRGVWRRRFTRAVATLAVGGLIGFLVPTIIADFTAKPDAQARTAESPLARQFITAYVADDQPTLRLLQIDAATMSRAARVKADYQRVDPPVHLGSFVVGNGVTVHGYAADVIDNDGLPHQLAWRVLTAAGSVQLIDPPPRVTTP
jgi:hypothetical protein